MKDDIDPVVRDWYKRFPKQPSILDCVEVLRSGRARGYLIDMIVDELTVHAQETPEDVIEAAKGCTEEWTRLMLLMAIEIAAHEKSVPYLTEVLKSENESERQCAIRGLREINTKEARTILFHAGEKA